MGKFNKKPKAFQGEKTRKTLRKEKRIEKKQRKQDHYVNRTKGGKFVLAPKATGVSNEVDKHSKTAPKNNKTKKKNKKPEIDQHTKDVLNDKKQHEKLMKEMRKQRKRLLKEANLEEDKVIKRLEKDLKLDKRKTKSIPKSFECDGLDCILFLYFVHFLFVY